MDDMILQARLYEAGQYDDIEKLSGMIQGQGTGGVARDVVRGAGKSYMDYSAGASKLNPLAAPGKLLAGVGRGLSAAGRKGQQQRLGIDAETQEGYADAQKETGQRQKTALGGEIAGASAAGQEISDDPKYREFVDQANTASNVAGQAATPPPGGEEQPPGLAPVEGGDVTPAPVAQPGTTAQTPFPAGTMAGQLNQPQAQAGAAPQMSPGQAMAQAGQAKRASKLAETKGGFGTGIVSNILTGGMSGIARGLYNRGQRKKGERAETAIAAGQQPTWKSYPDLKGVHDTISIRKAIQERNTTGALRNGYR